VKPERASKIDDRLTGQPEAKEISLASFFFRIAGEADIVPAYEWYLRESLGI
jgi:hypothetical protein